MDKSYVTMEQKVCMVCAKPYDTGTILLDKRLKNRFDMHTNTGWGMCEEHTKLMNDGYLALIGADLSKSELSASGTPTLEGAWRTGRVVHIRYEVAQRLFNIVLPPLKEQPFVFAEEKLLDKLEAMQNANADSESTTE